MRADCTTHSVFSDIALRAWNDGVGGIYIIESQMLQMEALFSFSFVCLFGVVAAESS